MTEAIDDLEKSVRSAALTLIGMDAPRARDLFNRLVSAAWASIMAEAEGDVGKSRLIQAQRRQEAFDRLLAKVSAQHAVAPAALLRKHPAKQKPHVFAARSHLAYELRQTGLFSSTQIGRKLGLDHNGALRSVAAWEAHLNGGAKPVDEETGVKAREIIRAEGLTVRQAAERLGVDRLKLKSRLTAMRDREREAK